MEPIHLDWMQLLAIIGTAVTTIGGGLWYAIQKIASWAKPWAEKLVQSWINLVDKLTCQHTVLEQFAASLSVLTQMVSSQQLLLNKGQHIILTVDDNPIDRKVVSGAIFAVMAENDNWRQLVYKEVDKLYLAYEFHPFCRLIILDLNLPDVTPDQVAAFLEYSKHCRVIVYTGEIEDKKYPMAFATVKKSATSGELKDRIREALTQ